MRQVKSFSSQILYPFVINMYNTKKSRKENIFLSLLNQFPHQAFILSGNQLQLVLRDSLKGVVLTLSDKNNFELVNSYPVNRKYFNIQWHQLEL